MNPKYKDFENWALKNNWFFVDSAGDKYFHWISPAGLKFTIITNGDNVTAHNDFSIQGSLSR
jgi:hypothetical protein